jgi:hypothetical protein
MEFPVLQMILSLTVNATLANNGEQHDRQAMDILEHAPGGGRWINLIQVRRVIPETQQRPRQKSAMRFADATRLDQLGDALRRAGVEPLQGGGHSGLFVGRLVGHP